MGDDWNKDDLPSWLFDDDDEPDNDKDKPEADDQTPEWQRGDEPGKPGEKPGKLGFTGELPWLQESGDRPDPVERAEQELFDWQQDEESTPQEQPAEGGMPSWLTEAGDVEETMLPSAELPPWLLDDEAEPEAPPEPEETWGDQLPEDFLSKADEIPESWTSEQTYDEWAEEQERIKRGPDLEEETPDLFAGDEPIDTGAPQEGSVPDWVLGLEELDESEAPDWLTGSEQAQPSGTQGDIELPAWLSDLEDEELPPATTEPAGEFDDDFFESLSRGADETVSQQADEPPDDDLSWLRDFDSEAAPEPAVEEELDADLLSSLGLGETPAGSEADAFDFGWLDSGEQEAEALPDADFLDLPDFGEPAASLQSEGDTETDFSWLDTVEPTPSPAADELDEDLLSSLGIEPEAEPEAGEFDLSWLEDQPEEAAETPEPAAWTDDAFVAEFEPETPQTPEADAFRFEFDEPDINEQEPEWLRQTGTIAPSEADIEKLFAQAEIPEVPVLPGEQPQTGELDDFLASLDADTSALPQTSDLLNDSDFDIDDLFSKTAFTDFEPAAKPFTEPDEDIAQAGADFLSELEANVGTVSAAALVRQREDGRALDELPERLQQLHERAHQLPTTGQLKPIEDDALTRILPEASEALVPVKIATGLPGIASTVSMTEEQKHRADLLRGILGEEAAALPVPSAIDQTYEADLELGEEFVQPAVSEQAVSAPVVTKRRKTRVQIDRILIALLLAAVMIAPFFTRFAQIGGLPSASFIPGSAEQMAFDQINSLGERDLVLVGIEYGPTAAAEMDGLTEAILRHILLRGARPVLVGGNPVGLLHASNILEAVAADPALLARLETRELRANRDYYVTRYLAADAIGLRAFGENTAALLLTDLRGQATGLNIDSLDDFALILALADQPETARNYAEQIAPLTQTPLVIAANAASAPLVEPYLSAVGIRGLLVGYRDAYTYLSMLGLPALPPTFEITPPVEQPEATPEIPAVLVTEEATEAATEAETPEASAATEEATADEAATEVPTETEAPTEAEPTELPLNAQLATLDAYRTGTAEAQLGGAQQVATDAPTEVEPTSTPQPTDTEAPDATNTLPPTDTDEPDASPTPSRTPTSTPTATGTPFESRVGFVASNQTVNIRSGPGTSFAVIDTVPSRGEVQVIGSNENATWLQVIVPETGTEGWVSAALIRIPTPTPEADDDSAWNGKPPAFARVLPARQDATDEPTEAVTEATEAAADEATPEATDALDAMVDSLTGDAEAEIANLSSFTAVPYRDERWYAMTLGTLASIIIITVGMVVNIARGLLRRRRR